MKGKGTRADCGLCSSSRRPSLISPSSTSASTGWEGASVFASKASLYRASMGGSAVGSFEPSSATGHRRVSSCSTFYRIVYSTVLSRVRSQHTIRLTFSHASCATFILLGS